MTPILKLAARSAWARRLTLGVTLFSIALSTAMLLSVERIRFGARQSFTQSVTGVDLIVGARTGGLQLMLYSVFHVGQATNNIDWTSFEALASHPAVAWAIPLSLGDSHRGFAVLGTSPEYFSRFRYGDDLRLQFRAGQPFAKVFDAVIGSELARQLHYKLDDSITLSHGLGGQGMSEHGDKPFRIAGILDPTGTPVDRTAHISLEAMTALHLDWVAGAPVPGLSIPQSLVQKFDLRPKEITSAMIGLKRRADVFRMQRFVNEFRGEPLLAVMPGVALDELWQTIGMIERALFAVSALVTVVGLAGPDLNAARRSQRASPRAGHPARTRCRATRRVPDAGRGRRAGHGGGCAARRRHSVRRHPPRRRMVARTPRRRARLARAVAIGTWPAGGDPTGGFAGQPGSRLARLADVFG